MAPAMINKKGDIRIDAPLCVGNIFLLKMKSELILYRKIANEIITKIENREYDYQLPSEYQLCEMFQISRQTARNVYNLLENENIIVRQKGKGTFVNPDLHVSQQPLKSPRKIAIMTPDINVFFVDIIKSLNDILMSNKYESANFINDSIEKENIAIDRIISQKFDGVIFSPLRKFGYLSNINFNKFDKHNIKSVMIGKPDINYSSQAVYFDDIKETYDAIRELIGRGYRSIIHVTDSTEDTQAVYERSEGYRLAAKAFFPQQSFHVIDLQNIDWKTQFHDALSQAQKPTAIGLVNDRILYPVYEYLNNSTKYHIPDEVGILGHDNNASTPSIPFKLSSIAPPSKKTAEIAFQMLEQMLIEGKPEKGLYCHYIASSHLILRDSTL